MIVTDHIKSLFQIRPSEDSINIEILTESDYPQWLDKQKNFDVRQLDAQNFKPSKGELAILVDSHGHIAKVCAGVSDKTDFWSAGAWVKALPKGVYCINVSDENLQSQFALAWGLGAYAFCRYKQVKHKFQAKLMLPCKVDYKSLFDQIAAIYWVRDLINTPAQDMMPTDLVKEAKQLAKFHKASCKVLSGEKLLRENYPAVYAVGKGSQDPPQLIDMRWGNDKHPLLTLLGKGVCYDTGGLDIKSAAGMLTMKKDMGGAAHAMGLAHLIMSHKLPVRLRVLIPAVENAISDRAYHPGDVIQTRAGLTVEVGNTDAEGRLVLADVLFEASQDNPDLMIDFATLTGAQRIAFGSELPAFFTGSSEMIPSLMQSADNTQDPAWPMPLFKPYASYLESQIADMNNISTKSSYGGAIVAALFLSKFVADPERWIHLDFSAWNESSSSGRPQGGEAMSLRMIFDYLCVRYDDQ